MLQSSTFFISLSTEFLADFAASGEAKNSKMDSRIDFDTIFETIFDKNGCSMGVFDCCFCSFERVAQSTGVTLLR